MNNLKTVRDAVIEFKSGIPFTLVGRNGWLFSWYKNQVTDALKFNGDVVCTFVEFNDYVGSMSRHAGGELYERYVRSKKSPLTKVAEIKPLYTQEMNDNGILPSAGMGFLDSESFDPKVKRICLLVDGDNAVYKDDARGVEYIAATLAECEPLPTPVKAEDKAVMDMIEQLTSEGIVTYDPIMLQILIEKFKANKITGVSFKEVK